MVVLVLFHYLDYDLDYNYNKALWHSKYFAHINAITYLFWMILFMNLFFLTVFLTPLTIYGVMSLMIFIVGLGYLIVQSKKQGLQNSLFGLEMQKSKLDFTVRKMISFIMKYGGILVAIYFVWKIIFPSSFQNPSTLITFIGLVAMWIVMDIAYIAALSYLFFPYLLQGYYKYKYPEDYRDWEGKTKEEWYGQKYLKKLEKRNLKNE